MLLIDQDPFMTELSVRHEVTATARSICEELANCDLADLPGWLLPYLAAAAAELTSVTGQRWRVTADDPMVALLRMIARVAITDPGAGGPHCNRLLIAMHLR